MSSWQVDETSPLWGPGSVWSTDEVQHASEAVRADRAALEPEPPHLQVPNTARDSLPLAHGEPWIPSGSECCSRPSLVSSVSPASKTTRRSWVGTTRTRLSDELSGCGSKPRRWFSGRWPTRTSGRRGRRRLTSWCSLPLDSMETALPLMALGDFWLMPIFPALAWGGTRILTWMSPGRWRMQMCLVS